jgi:hypothetical protein
MTSCRVPKDGVPPPCTCTVRGRCDQLGVALPGHLWEYCRRHPLDRRRLGESLGVPAPAADTPAVIARPSPPAVISSPPTARAELPELPPPCKKLGRLVQFCSRQGREGEHGHVYECEKFDMTCTRGLVSDRVRSCLKCEEYSGNADAEVQEQADDV